MANADVQRLLDNYPELVGRTIAIARRTRCKGCNSTVALAPPFNHCPSCHHFWQSRRLESPIRCTRCQFNIWQFFSRMGMRVAATLGDMKSKLVAEVATEIENEAAALIKADLTEQIEQQIDTVAAVEAAKPLPPRKTRTARPRGQRSGQAA